MPQKGKPEEHFLILYGPPTIPGFASSSEHYNLLPLARITKPDTARNICDALNLAVKDQFSHLGVSFSLEPTSRWSGPEQLRLGERILAVHAFTRAASQAKTLADQLALKRDPLYPVLDILDYARGVLQAAIATGAGARGAGESEGKQKRVKEPPKRYLKAYRVFVTMGQKQTEMANVLSKEWKKPISQQQVSRMLKRVREYLEAGNILPDLDAGPRAKKEGDWDSATLDIGKRQDGRPNTRRKQQDEDFDDR